MEVKMKKFLPSVFAGTICGAATFVTTFFLVPKIASGIPDFLWIGAALILSCVFALLIFKKIIPAPIYYIFISFLVQLLLAFVFKKTVSLSVGINLDSAFGFFELIGFVFPLILGTTFAQFSVLFIKKHI